MDPVKASPGLPLDPTEYIARFSAAARKAGLAKENFGSAAGHDLNGYVRLAAEGKPRIYLSSGIHGDEPAPPWALLRLVESGWCDDRFNWYVCPLLNPTGFARRTRENAAGHDQNRDYKDIRTPEVQAHVAWLRRQPAFDLVICVHEDWESAGFYLYELNPLQRPTLAHVMLEAARLHCPIETASVIDGRESAEPGIIRPVSDPLLRESWPEAIYLREHHGTLHYTIESPSALPLERRITTLQAVLRAALAAFQR